jgi:hypothetical protein
MKARRPGLEVAPSARSVAGGLHHVRAKAGAGLLDRQTMVKASCCCFPCHGARQGPRPKVRFIHSDLFAFHVFLHSVYFSANVHKLELIG